MAASATNSDGRMPSLSWRDAFDAVERPLAAGAEAWVQSETFMDALALTWKLQRRALHGFHGAVAGWLALWGVPSRADVLAIANQVAALERQLRELADEVRRERV
jgi:hypothetical protein